MGSAGAVELGSAIVALIEPHRGFERAFNRWWERDHGLVGGALAPWTIGSARWVATRELKALRHPRASRLFAPVGAGSFLSAFWIQQGELETQQQWVNLQMEKASAEGRGFGERDHLCTHRHAYCGGAFRDADGVPAELALERRYPGVVATWFERAPAVPLAALRRWILEVHWRERLAGSPVAMVLAFELLPKPDYWPAATPQPAGLADRLLLLHFLEEDPRACWGAQFSGLGAAVASAGQGELLLAAPFIPTVPGTERYLDELW